MGPLKKSPDGFKYIVNFIDLFTSWPESIALKTLSAEEVSKAFKKAIVSRFACPEKLLTDQGTNFMSKSFKKMCSEYGITHLQSSAYHHQTNGKVERFHKFLENSLAAVVKKDQSTGLS